MVGYGLHTVQFPAFPAGKRYAGALGTVFTAIISPSIRLFLRNRQGGA